MSNFHWSRHLSSGVPYAHSMMDYRIICQDECWYAFYREKTTTSVAHIGARSFL